jgi:hypothetical protein
MESFNSSNQRSQKGKTEAGTISPKGNGTKVANKESVVVYDCCLRRAIQNYNKKMKGRVQICLLNQKGSSRLIYRLGSWWREVLVSQAV